jgi:preprotein translocase subunit SecG
MKLLYWLAVAVVSLALLVGLVLLLESRDSSSLSGGGSALPTASQLG